MTGNFRIEAHVLLSTACYKKLIIIAERLHVKIVLPSLEHPLKICIIDSMDDDGNRDFLWSGREPKNIPIGLYFHLVCGSDLYLYYKTKSFLK